MSTVEHRPNVVSTGTQSTEQMVRQTTAKVVVSVGTDHHCFDRLVGWIDDWCDLHPEVPTVVQAGTSAPSRHSSRELIPHGELLELFQGATVVVSHGGPSTVMDARMSGRLPIVVARNPANNEHVDGHQMRFVEHLERHGVAVVVDTRDALFAAIDRALADPDAFAVTADHCDSIGVAEFGRAVDQLIGTRTPIVPVRPTPVATDSLDDQPTTPTVDRRSRAATKPLVERRKASS